VVSNDDFLEFVDEALDLLVGILSDLGDELSNRRPNVPRANSPFAILTHCLGVMEYWGGHVAAGRTIQRDRDAEFRAQGRVSELIEQVNGARARFRADVTGLEPAARPMGTLEPEDAALPLGRTAGGALIHVYEELERHLGQMELTRDILRAPWGELA
jgi:hypothetical protein